MGVNFKLWSATGNRGDVETLINFIMLAARNYAGILVGALPPQDAHDVILLIIEETLDGPGVGLRASFISPSLFSLLYLSNSGGC